jgi:hypothetical protein
VAEISGQKALKGQGNKIGRKNLWRILANSGRKGTEENVLKGTVSPDYKCLDMIYIKSPGSGHVTPDI